MLILILNNMRTVVNIKHRKLQDRTVYIKDVVDDLRRIVHDVDDMIDKGFVVVFDKAGIFPGYDDFKVALPFDLLKDSSAEIRIDRRARDHLALMDTDRAVFGNIRNVIVKRSKNSSFIIILAPTGCYKMDPLFR